MAILGQGSLSLIGIFPGGVDIIAPISVEPNTVVRFTGIEITLPFGPYVYDVDLLQSAALLARVTVTGPYGPTLTPLSQSIASGSFRVFVGNPGGGSIILSVTLFGDIEVVRRRRRGTVMGLGGLYMFPVKQRA